MRRRRRLPPDTRPRWNDPDLPVYYDVRGPYPAENIRQISAQFLETKQVPNWKKDRTYDLKNRPLKRLGRRKKK